MVSESTPADSAQPQRAADIGAPQTSRRGKGFLAVSGSAFFHGLGHIFAGRYRRGLFWFALSWGLACVSVVCAMFRPLMPLLIVLIPLGCIVSIGCLIDAYRTGKRSERPMLGRPGFRYLAGLGIIVACIFLNPALWGALQIRTHLIEAFVMPSTSMAPALTTGDRFLVNKRTSFGRWSIVGHDSLHDRSVKFAKRIVALPGETVEIIDGEIVVDGKIRPRPPDVPPYRDLPDLARRGIGRDHYHTTLGKDEYFVLGDNSINSADSRIWTEAAPGHQRGVIPADYIIGRATAIYWPPQRWRRFE
jgi:signal peptidase I